MIMFYFAINACNDRLRKLGAGNVHKAGAIETGRFREDALASLQ